MTPRFHCLLWMRLAGVLLLLLVTAPSWPQPTASPPALDLATEERLQSRLTIEEAGISLAELLKKLSRKNLTLTADRACADLKLQIRLKQRPLYILMRSLAQLVPGSWEPLPDKSGFRLNMSVKAVQRRTRWWQVFLEEREKAKAAQRAYLLNQMRAEPFRRKPGDPNPENSDLAVEAQITREHEFFRLLPSALQEQIVNQVTDCPLYLAGVPDFGTDYKEGVFAIPLDSLPQEAQKQMVERATAIFSTGNFAFDFDNAVVTFANGGFVVLAGVAIQNGKEISYVFKFDPDIAPAAFSLLLNQRLLALAVRRLGTKAPPAWKELADYQESRVWKNDPPPKDRRIHPNYGRTEVLQWLAETTDLEYVADCYHQGGNPMPPAVKRQPPADLKAELDFWATDHDTSWTKRPDNIYLFRNNRWYRDDYLQVPDALLRRWYALRQEQKQREAAGATPTEQLKRQLEWEAEIVTTLTPWQILGLGAFALPPDAPTDPIPAFETNEDYATVRARLRYQARFPFRRDPDRIFQQINTIRFYASLDTPARDALIAGRLPFASLSPTQQEKAVYLAPRLRVVAQRRSGPILLRLEPKRASDALAGDGVQLRFSMPGADGK